MVPKREKTQSSDYQGKIREKNWLGSKDSNLDCMIQSCPSNRPNFAAEYRFFCL
jgi:hypothetical protein